MLVSIIIPIYNVATYLPQCIESVLNQTYTDIEVILVDDGATDNSGIICDSYANKDQRISVIHQPNMGLSVARNVGLLQSTGEYIMFLDGDDFWKDAYSLQSLLDFVTQNPAADFIGFNSYYYYEAKNQYDPWLKFSELIQQAHDKNIIIQELVKSGVFPMSACMKIIKRNFLMKNHLFFEKDLISEDIPWFIDLLDKSNNIKITNLYIYAYRRNREGSISKHFTSKTFDDTISIIDSELKHLASRNFTEYTKNALLSFLGYNICILLARIQELPRSEREPRRTIIKHYLNLLQYTENPKVKYVRLVYRFLGLTLTEKLLNLFMYYKSIRSCF